MWDDEKPYEGCIPITLINVDRRGFKSPEEYDERLAERYGSWFSQGTNHRIVKNGIARDIGTKTVWGLEVNSLEELMNLKDEVGEELILRVSYIDYKTPMIEIYDDYRE
jgi:hypothetical protein